MCGYRYALSFGIAAILFTLLFGGFIIPPAEAATDLSGTWQIIDPAGQYSGSAVISGGDGYAAINTYVWIIPVTLHEPFTIVPKSTGGMPTYTVSCSWGSTSLIYSETRDALFYDLNMQHPYAIRV